MPPSSRASMRITVSCEYMYIIVTHVHVYVYVNLCVYVYVNVYACVICDSVYIVCLEG